MNGVMIFVKKKKVSPRYISIYTILERVCNVA